jgi:hypothetical protein
MSIVDDLKKSARDIHDAIDGLTENQLTRRGAVGDCLWAADVLICPFT